MCVNSSRYRDGLLEQPQLVSLYFVTVFLSYISKVNGSYASCLPPST